eukprot:TRINITY_DN204_c0_g1_i1.p1 TRINITY_DN204_c0_g1~~TRINITY_DN204_c0_g1_i1.p1  ORF type:complete len:529 (-),score=77.06 TRINITY_DN204_c0_g1_i1:121-1707(-)
MCWSKKQFQNYWVNNGFTILFLAILVILNAILIIERLFYYTIGEGKDYAFSYGVPIARSTAAAIRLDCGVLLISVLRNALSWSRGTFVGTYLPVDKNISLHMGFAWLVLVLGSIHTTAHFVNVYAIAHGKNLDLLVQLGVLKPGAVPPDPLTWAFTTVPGATGVVACIAMILMYTTAVSSVRRPMFELFWYTHHLFIVFFIILCCHGLAGLLEPPMFWMWTIGPMVFYLIERIIRSVRKSQKTIIVQAIQHPSKTLEIRMRKATFNYQSGQYVFLCCPYIADFEWHPFTISSSPDEDFMSVHIRIVGDWTGKLYNMLNPEGKLGVIQENMITAPNGKPILLIDGPFGTASEDVWNFETVHLWAAGIGVTPFASILKSIKHNIENDTSCKVKNIEFFWSNRDQSCFEWFIDLLADLEQKVPSLRINLYFTGELSAGQVRAKMNEDEEVDLDEEGGLIKNNALTGLRSQTTFGRPDIDVIFAQKAQEYQGQRIGVFFCGPAVLSRSLLNACEKNTSVSTETTFVYHKENF